MRVKGVSVGVALAAWLLGALPAPAVATGPFPIAVTPLGANSYGIVGAVYRARANEYAFFSTESPGGALPGIYLHRLDVHGGPAGEPVRVTAPPEPDARIGTTAVAYDPRHDSYLVVFNWWRGDDFNRGLLAQRVSGDGRAVGPAVQVTPRADPGSIGPFNCVLRYDSRRGRFLMLWQVGDVLQARALAGDGRPVGRAVSPLPAPPPRVATNLLEWDAAYDPRTRSWLAVWGAEYPNGQVTFARRLGAGGAGAGSAVRVGSARLGRKPQLTFNPRTGRFLLVTAGFSAPTHHGSLHLTALDSAGRHVSRGLTIVAPTNAAEVFSAGLAFATRSGRALLSWGYLDDEGHAGLFFYPRVQLVDGRGRHRLGHTIDIRRLPATPPFTDPDNGVLFSIYNTRLDEFMVVFMRLDLQTRRTQTFGYLVAARP